MKDAPRLYYDEEANFLEISVGNPTPCYAEEIKPGIFVRIDESTKEVKSIGILGFKERSSNRELTLPINLELSK